MTRFINKVIVLALGIVLGQAAGGCFGGTEYGPPDYGDTDTGPGQTYHFTYLLDGTVAGARVGELLGGAAVTFMGWDSAHEVQIETVLTDETGLWQFATTVRAAGPCQDCELLVVGPDVGESNPWGGEQSVALNPIEVASEGYRTFEQHEIAIGLECHQACVEVSGQVDAAISGDPIFGINVTLTCVDNGEDFYESVSSDVTGVWALGGCYDVPGWDPCYEVVLSFTDLDGPTNGGPFAARTVALDPSWASPSQSCTIGVQTGVVVVLDGG